MSMYALAVFAMWGIALALIVRTGRPADMLFAALYVCALLALLKRRNFPHRNVAFALSWVGPLLTAVYQVSLDSAMKMDLTASGVILSMTLLRAVAVSLALVWLFAGYGMVPFVAVTTYLLPKRALEFEKLAASLPGRYWWALPLGILVVYLLQGILLARLVS